MKSEPVIGISRKVLLTFENQFIDNQLWSELLFDSISATQDATIPSFGVDLRLTCSERNEKRC